MKKRKWWWIIGMASIALLVIGSWRAEIYLKKRIKKELQIQTAYGDTLQINQVDLGLLGGWMTIDDVMIRWNISQQNQAKEASTYLVRGEIGKIRLKGLNFFQYLLRHKIYINKLLIDSSALDLYLLQPTIKKLPATVDSTSGTKKKLAIDISGIKIAPSRIRFFEAQNAPASLEVDQLSMEMNGFYYPQQQAPGNLIDFFSWSAGQLRYGRPEQFSDLLITEAGGNSVDSSLSFSQLRFLPRYSKAEYSRLLKHKNSRVDVAVSQGRMEGLDWLLLLNEGRIDARKFTLDTCVIEVYEDSRLPIDESRYKSLYQEKLLATTFGVSVDSALIRQGLLAYQIQPKEQNSELGFLKFQQLEATVTNITNDSLEIAARPLLRAEINSLLNGESKLSTYFTFDLSSPTAAYTYAGDMHGFELPKFNTILMETSRMEITEGKMQHLHFEVNADKYVAKGEMRIDYSGLKIKWLKQHSFFAATAQKILMLEQNPRNGKYRVGQIYFERLPYRSFWNYYVKSLLSGLNSTAMPNLFLPKELDAQKAQQ